LRWEAYKAGIQDLEIALSLLESVSSKQQTRLLDLIARVGRATPIELPADISEWQHELYSYMT
jgi:hypothetical protein